VPIALAAHAKRIAWDDPDTRRQADATLRQRLVDGFGRAATYIDVTPPSGEDALDRADARLVDAVAAIKARLDAPSGLEREDLLELCRLAVELQDLHREHQERQLGRQLRALSAVRDVLVRPRGEATVDQLLERATIEACRGCGFDRAMLFLVDASTMSAHTTYFHGHDAWAAECHAVAAQQPIPLGDGLLETEMLRRRAPALMLDPMSDARAYHPIVDTIETRGYVAVPVMPEGKVIATIHADRHFTGRGVDPIDRDALATFATGLGSVLERHVLVERLAAQRDHVRAMLTETDAFVSAFCESEISLGPAAALAPAPTGGLPPVTRSLAAAESSRAAALLSRRELEVLRLLATGATNAQIADQLVLSEGTVKSHVKRILRKLHASNRAEAVSRFLRIEGGREAVEEAAEGFYV
jgi:DNA-binding CsgD family transcriptional regulator